MGAKPHTKQQYNPLAAPNALSWLLDPARSGQLLAAIASVGVHAVAGLFFCTLSPPARPAVPLVSSLVDMDLSALQPVEPPSSAPPKPTSTASRSTTQAFSKPLKGLRLATRPPGGAQTAAAGDVNTQVREQEPELLDFGERMLGAAPSQGSPQEAGSQRVGNTSRGAGLRSAADGESTSSSLVRPARLSGGASWDDCPFPEEADAQRIRRAQVQLRVHVSADGTVQRAEVVSESSAGFGRETRRCALRRRWIAGTDKAGRAVAGTYVLLVKFAR